MSQDEKKPNNQERKSAHNRQIESLVNGMKNAVGRKARKSARVRKLKFLGKKKK